LEYIFFTVSFSVQLVISEMVFTFTTVKWNSCAVRENFGYSLHVLKTITAKYKQSEIFW